MGAHIAEGGSVQNGNGGWPQALGRGEVGAGLFLTTPLLEWISSEPLCAKGKALECEEGEGDTKEGGETVGNGIAQEGERCGARVRCARVFVFDTAPLCARGYWLLWFGLLARAISITPLGYCFAPEVELLSPGLN